MNVISFKMPSLRERKEDIPLLADHFMHRFAQEANKTVTGIERDALDEMMLHEWPGNVRELENAIERAVVIGKERKISPQDLPFFNAESQVCFPESTLKEVERTHILNILETHQWNIARSAKILGVDRSTLYAKIKRYNFQKPE